MKEKFKLKFANNFRTFWISAKLLGKLVWRMICIFIIIPVIGFLIELL